MWGLRPDMKEKEAQRGRRPSQEPHWPSREVGAMAAPGGACRVERPAQRPPPQISPCAPSWGTATGGLRPAAGLAAQWRALL